MFVFCERSDNKNDRVSGICNLCNLFSYNELMKKPGVK